MVDKIVESVEARELFQFIDSSMQRRGAYREYLDNLQKGLTGKMKLTNDQYKKDVSSKHKLWTSILKVTRTCDVADAILQVASSYSVRLEMQKAKRSKTERRKLHPTPAQKILMDLVRNSKEGQENDQLRAQAGMPARTFELRELILKGVIVQLNAKLTGDFQKKMKFIIQYNNEEFTIQCVAANTSLRSFVLTREDLALMNAARKLATICWGDGFVWVNTFRLSRLLGFMAADGDL